MTNEGKSREISKKYGIKYDTITKEGKIIEMDKEHECYKSALEMAEWKDKVWRERAKTTFCLAKGCTNKCGTGLCEERILFDNLIDK